MSPERFYDHIMIFSQHVLVAEPIVSIVYGIVIIMTVFNSLRHPSSRPTGVSWFAWEEVQWWLVVSPANVRSFELYEAKRHDGDRLLP